MKKLATAALAIALAFSATTAMAQPEPGDAGIFADAAGTQTTLDVLPNVPYFVYAVAFDLDGGLLAYEVGLDGVPVGTFALSTTLFGPAPLNVGDANTFNYIVGTGGCVDQAGALPLVTWNFLSTVAPADDTALVLRGTNLSSFDGVPGYAKCDESIATFGVATDGGEQYPDGALILNATGAPVSGDEESFGSMKARF